MTSSARPASDTADSRSSVWGAGEASETAMTTSAQSPRATSTGRLRIMPPSDSTRPSMTTGEKAPGTAMLARIATDRSPLSSTTISLLRMSVATARNGIGSSSKSRVKRASATRARSTSSMSWVLSRPLAVRSVPPLMPRSRLLV